MTYSNIWMAFTAWCISKTEQKDSVNIPYFADMVQVKDKMFEGIYMRLSDSFLEKHGLQWDEDKASLETLFSAETNSGSLKQKLNILALGAEVEIPKLYVSAGLNNLMEAIGDILSNSEGATLDLAELGSVFVSDNKVHHLPSRAKKDVSSKKPKVRTVDANCEGQKERQDTFRKNLQISKMAKGEITNDLKDLTKELDKPIIKELKSNQSPKKAQT